MAYIIYGLGNAGDEYAVTRHNTGRMALDAYYDAHDDFDDTQYDKKKSAHTARCGGGKSATLLVWYEGFMNNSGKALVSLVKNQKQAEQTIVIYDDVDLPLGSFKISFDRGDGGHNGLKSVISYLKTKKFIRVRIGVAQTTPKGKLKKPRGEDAFKKYLLSPFKPDERKQLKKVFKAVSEALDCLRTQKREKCTSMHHLP